MRYLESDNHESYLSLIEALKIKPLKREAKVEVLTDEEKEEVEEETTK